MSDEVDDLLRRAMATLDDQAPPAYFDTLPARTLARLDEAPPVVPLRRARRVFAVVGVGLAAAAGLTLFLTRPASDRAAGSAAAPGVQAERPGATAVGGPAGTVGAGSAASGSAAHPVELDAGAPTPVDPPPRQIKQVDQPVKQRPAEPVDAPPEPVKQRPAEPVDAPPKPVKPPPLIKKAPGKVPGKAVNAPGKAVNAPGKPVKGKPLGKQAPPDGDAPLDAQRGKQSPDAAP